MDFRDENAGQAGFRASLCPDTQEKLLSATTTFHYKTDEVHIRNLRSDGQNRSGSHSEWVVLFL